MAQMFGRHAFELLQEVASCPAESLPPFNEELFRNVLDEVTLQHERLTTVFNNARQRHLEQREAQGLGPEDDAAGASTWRGTEAEAAELMVYHTSILRNKRLIFAYVKERVDRIQELRWGCRALPEHVRTNLSPLELDFSRRYDQGLNRYMRAGRGGVGIDLTADPVPPDDPYVQVRVLKSYGEVLFASGKVSLQRGKSHWLPRDEAHPLVMEGVLAFVASGGQ